MSKLKDISVIPLSILDTLKPFVKKEADVFDNIPYDDGFIKYQGKGINKNFFFSIISYEKNGADQIILIEFKPSSIHSTVSTKKKIVERQLESSLNNWSNLLRRYIEHEKIFTESERYDRIVDEFYSEFDFIKDDEEGFFTVPELVKIDTTIEQLENWIEDNQQQFLPVLYDQIKREISDTKEGLTENSKGWIARKIAKIQALIMKQGPRLLKETAVEVLKATVAEVIKTKLIG